MTTIAAVEVATERPGINIAIGDGEAPVVSDVWGMGSWTIQFVRLDAGQRFELDHAAVTTYVKVVTGHLTEPDRRAYAAPRVVRDTSVAGSRVVAGAEGAVFCVFTGPQEDVPIRRLDLLRFRGPHDEALRWTTFEQRYGGVTQFFDGLDAHLAPGFHLLDADGAEIAYVFVWAAGKGVDLSTHDHGRAPSATAPAFAEVHWVVANGTGEGGMYETAAPGAAHRDRYPVRRGQEHGPFFYLDPDGRRPRLRENGAVDYPWHGWEAGPDDGGGQAYDVVVAFEITTPYARL